MKYFIFVLILLGSYHLVFCQNQKTFFKKPVLELHELGKWALVSAASISSDGNYVIYGINDPSTSTNLGYVQSLNASWKINIGSGTCQFTSDSKYFIYESGKDSLCLIHLIDKDKEYISDVSSFKVSNDGKWVAYLNSKRNLTIRNLETKKEKSFDSVNTYFFNPGDNSMLMESVEPGGSKSLIVANFSNGSTRTIWKVSNEEKTDNYIFSQDGKELACIVEKKSENSILVYNYGNEQAHEITNQELLSISKEMLLNGINYRGFTDDGKMLFIELKEKNIYKSNVQGVDVWSYTDEKLQSEQLKQLKPKTYIAALNIEKGKALRIEEKDETITAANNNFAIVVKSTSNQTYNEWPWNKSVKASVYLVSLIDAARQSIGDNLHPAVTSSYQLSPAGKYVVYYNAEDKNYFSYEITTATKRNITKGVNAAWTTYANRDIALARYRGAVGFSGEWMYCAWLKQDSAVLLYDQCDIYQADLSGKTAPVNLTNGIGHKNNIEFRSAIENDEQVFTTGDQLIVSAFNRENKNDGFYKITIGRSKPELLSSQPYVFKGTWENVKFPAKGPVKAKNANVFLVRRMSAEESPNYFWTKDFIEFYRITDVRSEKDYNWLTSELISWKLPDGSTSQGILYKPENFDAHKKYPIIFNYYERMTEGLHAFLTPELSLGNVNIPFLVSNGYLVFTPDIHYTIGHPGRSVVSTIVSAAKYLSKQPFVDSKRVGLQGHSRGGWETNFIITHTNLFAAAVSASGMCDYISLYNQVREKGSGGSRQGSFEMLYQRIGATLWEKPELYIENSPIFKADKVTTPVLMMANKEDEDVPFQQGVEFFTALRRLGKKAWMLQYDGEGHVIFGKAAEDYTFRMKQFFDHYLKDAPAPKWMIYGIRASQKGLDDGLELVNEKDSRTGKWLTPAKGGLLKDQEKKKIQKLDQRKPTTITLE